MPLKINEMMEKAKKKGYTKPESQTSLTKPWQNESILTQPNDNPIRKKDITTSDNEDVLVSLDPNKIKKWKFTCL